MASSDPVKELEQRIQQLLEEHGQFILDTLRSEGVRGDAVNDLAQEAKLILREHVEEGTPLPSPRGFLTRVIRYLAKNHKRFEARRANAGIDVAALPSQELDPERKAEKDELWAKVIRYLAQIPEPEADAVFDIGMMGSTIAEAAEIAGLSRSTMASLHDRGVEMLQEMARKSKRETVTGVRRRRIAAAAAKRAREKLAK